AISRAKQTVTAIKRQQELKDEYSAVQLVTPFQKPIVKRPAFMQREKTITSAEKGTIIHTAMQHLTMNRRLTLIEIEEELEKMVEKEILSKEEVER
ncbi:hypothetical protein, partial [Virgibacillus salexigens]|uniref:hypothetical protein n=1 Tax=Virgibacillus salexigens TaxID=61016 RepID=UPI00308196CF